MQVSELIAVLHHEVAKTYTFVAETRGAQAPSGAALHMDIEQVEVELPVSLGLEEVLFDPVSVRRLPMAYQHLALPFAPQRGRSLKKPFRGRTVTAEVVGHVEKLDERITQATVGRIRIVFKLVLM